MKTFSQIILLAFVRILYILAEFGIKIRQFSETRQTFIIFVRRGMKIYESFEITFARKSQVT